MTIRIGETVRIQVGDQVKQVKVNAINADRIFGEVIDESNPAYVTASINSIVPPNNKTIRSFFRSGN